MAQEEIETIIKSFSKTLLAVNKFSAYLCAEWYPESLLEYPKVTIKKALERALLSASLTEDQETEVLLKTSLAYLESFIDDEEAYRRNHRIMGQRSYWEALRRQN